MKIKNTVLTKFSRGTTAVVICGFLLLHALCNQGFGQEIKKMPRMLAPGVMKTIKPDLKFQETFTNGEIVEVTSLGAEFDWAKLRFPTKVYAKNTPVTCLEFQFKLPRIIEVDLPTTDGQFTKTPVWYIIYCVTNKKWSAEDAKKLDGLQVNLMTSSDLEQLATDVEFGSTLLVDEFELGPDEFTPGRFNAKVGESSITFVPQFILASESLLFPKTQQYVVPEQVIPLALPTIIQQEDPNRAYETTVSMADRKIEPGETVWGIAMWKDIDPEVKDFTIYVSGLSSAYLWSIDKDRHQPGVIGSGYSMSRKTLKLNFWIPGSADHLLNREIQYGTITVAKNRFNDDEPYRLKWRAIAGRLADFGTRLQDDAQYLAAWQVIDERLRGFASQRFIDDPYRTKSRAIVELLGELGGQLEMDAQYRAEWLSVAKPLKDLFPPVDYEWVYR